jgi:hypothetical protein
MILCLQHLREKYFKFQVQACVQVVENSEGLGFGMREISTRDSALQQERKSSLYTILKVNTSSMIKIFGGVRTGKRLWMEKNLIAL